MSKPNFDIDAALTNDSIGTKLVSKTDAMSVWHIHLKPGEVLPPHRHDRPYFWTVLTDGKGQARYGDGRIVDVEYRAGETQHHAESKDTHFTHDLINTGDTELVFVTVEFNLDT